MNCVLLMLMPLGFIGIGLLIGRAIERSKHEKRLTEIRSTLVLAWAALLEATPCADESCSLEQNETLDIAFKQVGKEIARLDKEVERIGVDNG